MKFLTMYRLMLYYLLFLVVVASLLSFTGLLPYQGLDILVSAFYIVTICKFSNEIFAKLFKVPTNPESSLITGFILSLIIGPGNFFSNLPILTLAAILAMASKYFINIGGKHIFNPAAFGAVAGAIILNQGASWWVGDIYMLPAIFLGGILILRKIKRYEIVVTFLLTYLVFNISNLNVLIYSPIIFFSLVMIVEPFTSPPTRNLRIMYTLIVAILSIFIPRFLPNIYYSLEVSLLIGNIFSFMVSKDSKQTLKFVKKVKENHDVTSFIFESMNKIKFKSGQYFEWTLPHISVDSRGIRRFFTISASPTENFLMLSTKLAERSSSFKTRLFSLKPGDEIIVSNLQGDFTLTNDKNQKLVFIAGGIGITPFRSMIKSMIDRSETRNIILLFSNKTDGDIVFKEILKKAEKFGVRTVFVNTDKQGYIDEKMIKKEVPDWKERRFYLSGPEAMVETFEKLLYKMGVSKRLVKRDYFPGYE